MSGRQKIFNLPYPRMANKGLNQQMLVLLDRNLLEIERQLSFTQLYQEDTVKEVIDSSGNLKTDKLDDKTVGLEHALQIANQAVTTAKIALKAVTEALLADGAVTNLKLAAGAVTEAKTNWQTHLLSDYAIADNTPQVGYVSWSNVKIVYKGEEYTVTNGSSNKLYLWWDLDYPDIMQAADTLPAITDDDVLIFLNKNGTHLVVPKATVVDGSLLVSESVLTDALAANAVTSIKIAAEAVLAVHLAAKSVTAEKINVENLAAISANLGTVNAGFINVGDRVLDITDMATAHDGQVQNDANVTAYFPFDDSLYDSKNLVECEFSRESVAYIPNGAQVAPDIARYDTARIVRGVMIEEGTENLVPNPKTDVDLWNEPTVNGKINHTWDDTEQALLVKNYTSVYHGHSFWLNIERDVYFTISAKVKNVTNTLYYFVLTLVDSNNAVVVRGYAPEMTRNTWNLHSSSDYEEVGVTYRIPTGVYPTATKYVIQFVGSGSTESEIYFKDIQLERKAYKTSWCDYNGTRAPEVLTIPTAGIFQKGNWTVELTFNSGNAKIGSSRPNSSVLFDCYIDANNRYLIYIDNTQGRLIGYVMSNGTAYQITDTESISPNTDYCISFCGDSSQLKLFKNNAQIGTDTAYIEPIGDLPSSMRIGGRYDDADGRQINGIIDELRFSKVARTLSEHQAYYNSQKGYIDINPIIRAGQMIGGIILTPDGKLKCYDPMGNYAQLSALGGLKWYRAGIGKAYHYLTEIGRASTVGTGYRGYDASPPDNVKLTGEKEYLIYVPPITVQLPEDFKGKNFEVFAELRMNGKNLDTYYRRVVLAMAVGSVRDILWVCEVYDYDYINATFKIKAYSYMHGYEANKASQWYEMVDGVDISYIVTA